MAQSDDPAEPNARILADLSALADGSLDEERAKSVRELIERSPDLRHRYEHERGAVAALHTLRSDRAPARLRIAIDRSRRPARPPRTRIVYRSAVAAVAAAVAAVIVLLPGAASTLSVSQAAALALRGPAMPPPTPQGGKLKQDVQEVYFPDWSGSFGWRASGQRVDHIHGRLAVTVFYRRGSRQIAYTILTSPALRWPQGKTGWVHGIKLRSFSSDGRLIVTWRRANHTCVLSAASVSTAELARLAAWKAPGLAS